MRREPHQGRRSFPEERCAIERCDRLVARHRAALETDKADLSNVVRQLADLVGPAGPKAQCFPIAPLAALAGAKEVAGDP